ncbi:hypothetical protein KHS38_18395 [Mucilaginibacter sp. Bleaf8]|uniref:HU domain-containing protein n=1 Tax=Mucilaginibacter sp. Bleaf8 TaxID=2834430 RepID=UPI001BCB0BD6|nr:hypothetical protein [Mucilaginibacter sp. Bleaf8]MBS7566385.1 hypothetical protein [Mucilaginibacter sp. Bleaf8]
MDLAVYISELLKEHGTVIIPGLGIFNKVRVASYYNKTEGQFYPPHYQAGFTHQPGVTDQALAQYISAKNNVSSASARFFINKWVADVTQQAETQEVAISKLGALYKQNNELKFKPNTADITMSAIYGFSAVSLRQEAEKLAIPVAPTVIDAPVEQQPQATPVEAAPEPAQPKATEPALPVQQAVIPQPEIAAQTVIIPPAPVKPAEEPLPEPQAAAPIHSAEAVSEIASPTTISEETETNTPSRNSSSRWIVIAVILLIAIGAGFAIYQTQRNQKGSATEAAATSSASGNTKPVADTVIINKPTVTDTPVTTTVPATDSVNQHAPAQVVQPTAASQASALMVNNKNYKYTLLGGACSTMAEATAITNRYKVQGVNAGVLKNPPGDKYFKISFGFFETFTAGQQAKQKLVETKHLERSKLYVETIRQNPKK